MTTTTKTFDELDPWDVVVLTGFEINSHDETVKVVEELPIQRITVTPTGYFLVGFENGSGIFGSAFEGVEVRSS